MHAYAQIKDCFENKHDPQVPTRLDRLFFVYAALLASLLTILLSNASLTCDFAVYTPHELGLQLLAS